jgi:hypothetical protein
MFEKISSLKDFIIYFIPGVLTSYFGLFIFEHDFKSAVIKTEEISKDNTLTFIGIVFSFLIGFMLSQIQIILVNKLLRKRFKKMRTIKKSFENELIKETLITKVIEFFNLPSNDRNSIEKDNLIVFSCLNVIKIKGSAETNFFLDRMSNLSSFASASFIPIVLGSYCMLLKFNLSDYQRIIMLFIESIYLIIILRKIIINYRDDWFKNIYRQFLILVS